MTDLAIIIVSTSDAARWLPPCLSTVFEHAGSAELDVVVVDNSSTPETTEQVCQRFPQVRLLTCENRGFSHANNRGLMTCDARYVLFLNPDTEIVEGTLEGLIRLLEERPSVGLAGVRQITADGELYPTMRRFPNALRALGEALGAERLPFQPGWSGERVLDQGLYEREITCDWTSGSFMLARREALEGAGFLDERFFIFAEEADLALRIKKAGWEVRHLPQMTILHHAVKAGINPRLEAQNAYSKLQYARKNFSPAHRGAYVSALYLRYLLRAAVADEDPSLTAQRRAASRHALRTLAGLDDPPFREAPPTSVAARDGGAGP